MKPNSRVFFLLATSLNSLAHASSVSSRNASVAWQPCPQQNGSAPIDCGTLTVPLDYLDPTSNKTLDLQLVKISATKQPRKGSVLFNPGGPGDIGRDLVAGDSGPAFLL